MPDGMCSDMERLKWGTNQRIMALCLAIRQEGAEGAPHWTRTGYIESALYLLAAVAFGV